MDMARVSLASKIKGREPILIHIQDAAARGIANGDIVRVHNPRGPWPRSPGRAHRHDALPHLRYPTCNEPRRNSGTASIRASMSDRSSSNWRTVIDA